MRNKNIYYVVCTSYILRYYIEKYECERYAYTWQEVACAPGHGESYLEISLVRGLNCCFFSFFIFCVGVWTRLRLASSFALGDVPVVFGCQVRNLLKD